MGAMGAPKKYREELPDRRVFPVVVADRTGSTRAARAGMLTLALCVLAIVTGGLLALTGLPGFEITVAAQPVVALLVWRIVGRRPVRELLRTADSLGWALLAAVMAALIAGSAVAITSLLGATSREPSGGVWTGLLLAVLVGGLFTALPEEITYRGVLLRGLTSAWGLSAAVGVTTALFTLAHLPRLLADGGGVDGFYLVGLVLFALSMTALVIAAGSIWPAVGWHFGSNAVGIVVSNGLGLRPEGPAWWIGTTWSDGPLGLSTDMVSAAAALGLAACMASRRRYQAHAQGTAPTQTAAP